MTSLRVDPHLGAEEEVTSAMLIERIVSSGVKRDAARQMVRRAVGLEIWRSTHLSLQGGARLFARRRHTNTEAFRLQVLAILREQRPGLYRLARKIDQLDVVLKTDAEMLLASPVEAGSAPYPGYHGEVAALAELGILEIEGRGGSLESLAAKKQTLTADQKAAARLRAMTCFQVEVATTNILIEHFRRQNVISWNSPLSDDLSDAVQAFNNYRFFAYTFSHLEPLRSRHKDGASRPTPTVFHVVARNCETWDVEGFLARMARAGANRTSRLRMLGIIGAGTFSEEAWALAKKEGLITINLRTLFGDVAYEAMGRLDDLLKNVLGDVKRAKVEDYDRLSFSLDSLRTNPFVAELRSLSFEILCGFLVKAEGWEAIQLNVKVPFGAEGHRTSREVDVCANRDAGDKVIIVECKAEHSEKPLDADKVRKFFTETVPAYLAAKFPERKPSECRAELWTTGKLSEDAASALKSIPLKNYIHPRLFSRAELCARLPAPLKSIRRLLDYIAQVDVNLAVRDSAQASDATRPASV